MMPKADLCRDCGTRAVEPGLDLGLGIWTNIRTGFGGLQNFGRRQPLKLCIPCVERRARKWWMRIQQEAAEEGLLT